MKLNLSQRHFIDPVSKLQPKQFKQVFNKVCELSTTPMPQDSRPLKGDKFNGLYRVDIGEFRVIYSIDDDTINILLLGKRNDDAVYKTLERIL
jgi:mRNA interferase RelE/StbE